MESFNIGDGIIIKTSMYSKTPKWMEGYKGTITNLNKQSVTVRVDDYPNETHRVSYKDLRKF